MTGTIDRPTAPQGGRVPELAGPTGLTWYDVVLVAIPIAFGLAVLAGVLLDVAIPTALAAASTVGLGLILDAVFRNPPSAPR